MNLKDSVYRKDGTLRNCAHNTSQVTIRNTARRFRRRKIRDVIEAHETYGVSDEFDRDVVPKYLSGNLARGGV